jgi:hypothetical protein
MDVVLSLPLLWCPFPWGKERLKQFLLGLNLGARGRMEPGETMIESIKRECQEELGAMPEYIKLVPLEKFTTADQHFAYHTFFCTVSKEFVPELNHEHTGWAWLASGVWPRPMHPGLWSTVNFDAVRDKITTMELAVQTSQ